MGLTFREKYKQHATFLGLRHVGRAGRVVNEGSCGIAVDPVAECAGDHEHLFGAGRMNVQLGIYGTGSYSKYKSFPTIGP